MARSGSSTKILLKIGNFDSDSLFGEDRSKKKVIRAKARLDDLRLPARFEAVQKKMQDYVAHQSAAEPGFKIEKLISAPDRRETRRHFQGLLPRQVWDASTGPDDVVCTTMTSTLTWRVSPAFPTPCQMRMLTFAILAEMLNLSLERVRAGQPISESDAERIRKRYPELENARLLGRACDSVFKELCSAGQLRVGDEVVLTPFPFVSALAGLLLYFDFLQSLSPESFGKFQNYNYLRLNPLFQPNPAYRLLQGSRVDCPACKHPAYRRIFESLWTR
jgi:hypothetical protein